MANTDTNNDSLYEIGYLLAPTLPEAEAAEAETRLHDQVTAAGGEILASESPQMRELSYEIVVKNDGEKQPFSRGQFGWVQFSLSPDQVDAAEKAFISNADVIRHLLISIDAEEIGGSDISVGEATDEDGESDQ